MDFQLSQEQQMLQDSVRKFVQQNYEPTQRRKLIDTDLGYKAAHWQIFAELGWLSIPFAETHGGLGGNAIDLMVLGLELGRGLVTEPWLAHMVLAGQLVEQLAGDGQIAEWLPGIIQGETLYALAWQEAEARHNPLMTAMRAEPVAEGFRLTGRKCLVLNGQHADYVLVVARESGKPGQSDGLHVYRVALDQAGVQCQGYPLVDGGRAADLVFEDVLVTAGNRLEGAQAAAAIERVLDLAILASGAAAVGAMDVLVKTTVEYGKTRKQFGVPIGKFQALQHRMVDMMIAYERALSTLYMASLKALEGGDEARRAVAALKVTLADCGRLIGQEAIQLHGGMGMTDELNVGYYFKHLTAHARLFGDRDYHLDRYSQLMG